MSTVLFSSEAQDQLKNELQSEQRASKLENLAAALLGRLLDVPVAVAGSGFQHGGDAGPAGQHGRRFRLECKKYSDSTSLSERELLGEIDHALDRDAALEGWFLIATRQVPEQLVQTLLQKGEETGVPVVIIDWAKHDLARLAALCAFAPDLVETSFSPAAAALARALQPVARDTIASLRRQLQSWCLGFASLRARSHEKLLEVWNDPRTSVAELGQNVAGGAERHKVRRQSVHHALGKWWQDQAINDSPAVLFGWDGVGKTWNALDWLADTQVDQPIVLITPSSAVPTMASLSESVVKRFLGERLYELTGVRSHDHWHRRLDHLLTRPRTEGPVLTILFDGMNQEPSFAWLRLLQILQGPAFEGRVRVLTSTRTHHFEDKLSSLRGLIAPAMPIGVEVYDDSTGGELDQMLAFEGLTREALHPDVIEFARRPRLFKLVVRFRERLVEAGQVTVHRLLWEYGRDSFGERSGKSFSEADWQEWLREIAQRYRKGVREFSFKELGETARRADLSEVEVYARLSDIVDGRFAQPSLSGTMQLTPTVVAHALGTALLAHLDSNQPNALAEAEAEVTQWLDPIAGFDQVAEILRAAVSIVVERDFAIPSPIASALVTAWLQTQNVSDAHRQELASLAAQIPDAFLDAIEQSSGHSQGSARLCAVNALRAVPRAEGPAFEVMVRRARKWLSVVSRDVDSRAEADPKHEQRRSEWYRNRIGIDASGPLTILGVPLQLIDRSDDELPSLVPAIIEGFPVAKAMPCFEAAAVAVAVRGRLESWQGLKWLCHLNEIDPEEMGAALRDLSAAMRERIPEQGIHPELPARAAALLLWLSGNETDDEEAFALNPAHDRLWKYERDYLAQPSRSMFELERRHADETLLDKGIALVVRIRRTKEFWFDPHFYPPTEFVAELCEQASALPAENLYAHLDYTREQHTFEELEVALARCAPDLLAELTRRTIRSFATRPPEARYWSAIRGTDAFLLTGAAEATAAGVLRQSASAPEESQEWFAAGQLLMLEVRDCDVQTQFDRIVAAGVKHISTDFVKLLHIPTAQDVDALIARWGSSTDHHRHVLILLLSVHPIAFSDATWTWLLQFALDPKHELRGLLFRTLAESDEHRFGYELASRSWAWGSASDFWVNHYGSAAVMSVEELPFDQLAPRLAPWRLLEAVRKRGSNPAEVRLAAEILSHTVAAEKLDAPDPGSDLVIERSELAPAPLVFSAEPRSSADQIVDPAGALKAALDTDGRIEAYRRATETAINRIDSARKTGASLYLTNVAAADLELSVQHTTDLVKRWLEGYETGSVDFARRVRLAEGFYLALCEALLKLDAERGVQLWRILRRTVTTRYIGQADVDDMLHMVFRVPSSSAVEALREELLEPSFCHSDKALFQIALAASYNNQVSWLTAMIEKDRASARAWRRNRAVLLSGFTCSNTLPVPEAWPEGEIKTTAARLNMVGARWRFQEACARHWWQAYLKANDTNTAYAAWTLFLRGTDRRSHVWMRDEAAACKVSKPLFALKLAHAQLNRSKLNNAIKKRLEKLDKTFLGRDIVRGVWPWLTAR